MSSAADPSALSAKPLHARVTSKLKEEFLHVLVPTIYFMVGFNLIVFSTQLILARYLIHIGGFLLATTSALIVGKAVLVADNMPFLRRFDTAPLIWPILFKTFVYWIFVFVARLLEANIRYWIEHGTLQGLLPYMVERFSWHQFAFIQLWILVLFLIYVTASELNTLFGQGELLRILFTRGSTRLKLTRRQRIRTLLRLNRLTAGHRIAEIADPTSLVHDECLRLIAELSSYAARTATPARSQSDRTPGSTG